MAELLKPVQAGQVITHLDWNLAVAAINELLQTSQTAGIQIASVQPLGTADEPLEMSNVLQITGKNFGYSVGQAKVEFVALFGKATVLQRDMLQGSGDSRLLLLVPPIPGLPQAGASMSMIVDNGVGQDSRTVFVKPLVIDLSGDIFVNWRPDVTNPDPNPFKPDQQVDFAWQLQTADLNMPATFVLSATIQNAEEHDTNKPVDIPPGLITSIQFLDAETKQVLSNQRVPMGKQETRNIIVRIPHIPAAWSKVDFSLVLSATAGKVTKSDTRSFTVGQEAEQLDKDIVADLTGQPVTDVNSGAVEGEASGKLQGSTIMLKSGKQMMLTFSVQLKAKGKYDLKIEPQESGTLAGWTMSTRSLNPFPQPVQGDTVPKLIKFAISPTDGAASGTVVVSIQREGAALRWFKEFSVQLLPAS